MIEVLVDGLDHPEGVCWDLHAGVSDFPNGCAVTADGQYLWIVESHRPAVNRFGHLALVDSGLRAAPLHYPTRWAADA